MRQSRLTACLTLILGIFLTGLAFNLAAGQTPDQAKESFNQAVAAAKTGDTTTAIMLYQGAIQSDPAFSDAYLNLGSIQFSRKGLPEAAENFKKVTELSPTNPVGFLNYGKVLMAQEKYDLALAAYQGAQKADANNLEAEKEIGKLSYKLEKYDDCIASLEKFVKADSTDGYSYYLLGMAYKKKANTKQAMANYAIAIKRDPNDFESVYNMGNIYLAQSDFANAVTYFEKGLQLKPKHFKCAYNLAVAVESGNPGKLDPAIAAWDRFLQIARKNPKAADLVSSSEEHLKQLKDAKAAGQ